jgi:hypothetical protein
MNPPLPPKGLYGDEKAESETFQNDKKNKGAICCGTVHYNYRYLYFHGSQQFSREFKEHLG